MRAETLTHQDAFIGAVMLRGMSDKKAARAAVLKLSPAMFEDGTRRDVFAAMQRMAYAGEDVGDPVLIVSRAAQENNLNVEDVKVYVTRAAETCPAVSNLDNYAALVVEDYRLDLLQSALLAACNSNSSADRICAKVRAALNMQDAILATQAAGRHSPLCWTRRWPRWKSRTPCCAPDGGRWTATACLSQPTPWSWPGGQAAARPT